ncbi:MAG: tannase/feruloyl esterase family alpha/beta hydrolase [Acidobacteria bacterium]|nr:tannase/feruloyl esterase family alpha/beta hydrolase [Acidobacteriota bacterium]
MRIAELLVLALAPATLPAADCAALARLSLPSTTVTTATDVQAGSFTSPGGTPISNLPAFCRVAGVIRPSADSEIQFETWLPASGWNGKFQGIGNGGFAGSISYGGLADAVRRGYSAASTDTGHRASGQDAGWALGHPEKVIDFGHRAIHETAVKGKALTQAYYGNAAKRAYFNSCSNGGRQALMEAQRYPEDYDGIIAGAPANYWTKLMTNAVSMMQATAGDPVAYIPAVKLPSIQAAALAACDNSDGVRDGVIENPAECRFDPGVLQCQGAENDKCLTAPQVKALRKIYDGTRNEKGKLIVRGYAMGGEAEPGGWAAWITGPAPEKSAMWFFGTSFYKNMVTGDPNWDYRKFSLERDWKAAEQKAGAHLSADNPDLKRFLARGGKLILYHGWSDAAIPGYHIINYYESVQKKVGRQNTDSFVRLFMAPGVQHCGGGSGPNFFGQGGVAQGDAEHNIAAALERWVEQGTAPQRVIATRFKTGNNPSSGVEKTRPLCAYPKVAKYKGSGDTNDAANFTCEAAGRK